MADGTTRASADPTRTGSGADVAAGGAGAPVHWEAQYQPRARVADTDAYFLRWRERAAETRRTAQALTEHAYGPDPRQRIDVFHAAHPRGTLVFVHGGYWRAFCKDDFSWVADAFLAHGYSVALPSYPLAPQAPLAQIIDSAQAALVRLAREWLTHEERAGLVLAGHSAGAHLAMCVASREPALVRAAVGISGLYDLVPLLAAPFLANLGWTLNDAHAYSPLYWSAPAGVETLLSVGSLESFEFHSQSERLAAAWSGPATTCLPTAGRNHFSVLEAMADPADALHRRVLALFG